VSEVVGNVVIRTFSLTMCANTAPMFLDLVPTASRQERLNLRFLVLMSKKERLCVYSTYSSKSVPDSVFGREF